MPDATANYPLFEHMATEHGLTLLESELCEIARIVREMDAAENTQPAPGRSDVTHCWKDEREHIEATYGIGSDEWHASFDGPGGTCMLPDGHDGPHQFTPDDQIGVSLGKDNTGLTGGTPSRAADGSTED